MSKHLEYSRKFLFPFDPAKIAWRPAFDFSSVMAKNRLRCAHDSRVSHFGVLTIHRDDFTALSLALSSDGRLIDKSLLYLFCQCPKYQRPRFPYPAGDRQFVFFYYQLIVNPLLSINWAFQPCLFVPARMMFPGLPKSKQIFQLHHDAGLIGPDFNAIVETKIDAEEIIG
jgi:hypothetical protein